VANRSYARGRAALPAVRHGDDPAPGRPYRRWPLDGDRVESSRAEASGPRFAAEYLIAVPADGDQEDLMAALRYMAEAFGAVPQLAARARPNATTLHRTLSPKGNPELKSMTALSKAMGIWLAVQPPGEDIR